MVEKKQDLGLTVLTSSAVFGAWSAWNSSLFTAATFVDDEHKYKNAKIAMDLGLATAVATGIGVYLVYGDKGKAAAYAAGITGVVLYAAYYWKLRCNPKVSPFMLFGNKNKVNKIGWEPLSDNQISHIKKLIDTGGIKVVRDP